jgi:hypothetical protein
MFHRKQGVQQRKFHWREFQPKRLEALGSQWSIANITDGHASRQRILTSLAPTSSASMAHTREDETKRISARAATMVFCWPAAKHLYLQQDKGLQGNGGDSDKYV